MSLSELKRLVPSAFEKQGSAKLEKAEILQMTVDHLKMLHAKGKLKHLLDFVNFYEQIILIKHIKQKYPAFKSSLM